MTTNYNKLLQSRKNYRNGKARGFEWKPQPIPGLPLREENGIPETIHRIISLALKLELEVGEWIAETGNKVEVLPQSARELLNSNIADETVHFKAFSYAATHYTNFLNADMVDKEAQQIADMWINDKAHPLDKAATTETGVFLCSLTALRIYGGEALSTLSANVSRDEQRHVFTNRGLLLDLGYNPADSADRLMKPIQETLDWCFQDLRGVKYDKNFFVTESNNLVRNGSSRELTKLTNAAMDVAPFETDNTLLYM